MAKGKKTGGRNFTPGTSPNPMGRPKTPEDIKALKAVMDNQAMAEWCEIAAIHPRELDRLETEPGLTTVKYALIQFMKQAGTHGDPARVKIILELAGLLAPRQVNPIHNNHSPMPPTVSLAREEVTALLLLSRRAISECNSPQNSSLALDVPSSRSVSPTETCEQKLQK